MADIFNPHKIRIQAQNTDWGSDASFVDYGMGEDQPQDAGKTVQNKDGLSVALKSIVFVSKSLPQIAEGTEIKVFELDGRLRLKGVVSRFSPDHFRNRIWVS